MAVTVVWAQQPIPPGPSVFLAGPTPRKQRWWRRLWWWLLRRQTRSWRPEVIAEIEAQWPGGDLAVLVPEPQGGTWTSGYDGQIHWEWAALDRATAILFWVPRDLRAMPGFTTNVEFGLYVSFGRVVLGVPPDCPDARKNRYLIALAERFGVPVCETIPEAVAAALKLAGAPSNS